MRYFAEYDEKGKLIAIGAGDALDGVDITKEEYEALEAEIAQKAELAEMVYRCEIAIGDVPEEWQADVQERVDEMIADIGPYDPDEISDEEAMDIIKGVVG